VPSPPATKKISNDLRNRANSQVVVTADEGAATVHGVFPRTPRSRRVLAVLTGLAILAVLTACGVDLDKANFPRTTLPAPPGSGDGQVPTGAITDTAVAAPALRVVDPCPFVDKTVLAEFGVPDEVDSLDFDECSNQVTDAGGKAISISIHLGELVSTVAKVNGAVEGLPQIEDNTQGTTCFVTALTARTPDLGITVQVHYEGGDPCRPGVTLLQKVIKRLHESPPKYQLPTGTVLPLDPCTGIDDEVAKEIAPVAKKSATGLHGCAWNGSGPQLTLDYRRGYAPGEGQSYKKVDLGGGVSGFQRLKQDNGSECTVEWQHRALDAEKGETVTVDYTNYNADAAKDDPCGKAVKLARNVLAKLPKP
jgi:hypothetical protein